jgi:RNA polymerase sigma-70 factor, ECF subfamily
MPSSPKQSGQYAEVPGQQELAASDTQLVLSAKGGDERAFAQLFRRHQARALRVAFALLRNEQDAGEVVQDAFLRAHCSLGRYEGSASFFTWLYRIITNLSIDVIRKRHRRAGDDVPLGMFGDVSLGWQPDALAAQDPFELLCRAELGERLSTSIERLPNYHRGVIEMRELMGLSYEEMAQAMGVSKGTIMSRLYHARQKLQRSLAPLYKER